MWEKDIPKSPGVYWAKLFHKDNEPSIVLLSKEYIVYVFGNRERLSPYYDVKGWGKKIAEYK